MRPGRPCSAPFVRAWWEIIGDPVAVERATAAAVDRVLGYVRAVRPRVVLLNQYPSWQHRASGLGMIHGIGLAGLHRLADRLPAGPGRSTSLRTAGTVEWLVSIDTAVPDRPVRGREQEVDR